MFSYNYSSHFYVLQNWVTRTETAGPSRPGISGFQGHTLDDNSNLSDVSGLSQIEQLLKGKKFSRQVLHLVIWSVLKLQLHAAFMP